MLCGKTQTLTNKIEALAHLWETLHIQKYKGGKKDLISKTILKGQNTPATNIKTARHGWLDSSTGILNLPLYVAGPTYMIFKIPRLQGVVTNICLLLLSQDNIEVVNVLCFNLQNVAF